jgi:hypothetical protein
MIHARLAVALAAGCLVTASSLAATRTYVASYGNDGNTASNCGPTTPCRTFSAAMGVTDSGGEIIVLDSAGYGRITITKSLSIIAPAGIYAGLVAGSGQNAVDIATTGVSVVLKGLTINGQGVGNNGIAMTEGSRLTVESCEIANFFNLGLGVGNGVDARILDTVIRDNYAGIGVFEGAKATISNARVFGSSYVGIYSEGAASVTAVQIADSVIRGTDYDRGIALVSLGTSATGKLSVTRTTISGSGTGISVETYDSTATSQLSIIDSTVTSNNAGLKTVGSAGSPVLTVSQTLVTGNTVGLQNDLGTIKVLGNNTITDNGTNAAGSITANAPM